jgi:hypothetical protein
MRWLAMPLGGAALILAGCATDYESRMARCDAAAALILTYKAAQAAGGRDAGVNRRMVEAAGETMFIAIALPACGAARAGARRAADE